jgi:hypothetical protein
VSTGTGHAAVRADPEPGGPRPGQKWKAALLGILGVFVVLACYDLVSVSGQTGSNNTASASGTVTPTAKAAQSTTGQPTTGQPTTGQPTTAQPTTGQRIPTTGPSTAGAPGVPVPALSGSSLAASHPLGVASVAAFGPEGTSDGDSPSIASRILGVGTAQPWSSQWYATPAFGNLRSGTGLLLDMGETVTVTDARLALGSAPGADVQLRVGDSASLADLAPVADASDAAGAVRLTAAAPASGRYVLIWFTRLPLEVQGHYQVSVYSAAVDGAAVDGAAVDGTPAGG